MQYIGETTQKANTKFSRYATSMSGKIEATSFRWLAKCFSTWICKSAKHFVQIVEKWKGNGRVSRGVIDLAEVVLKRKREIEWMINLGTAYIYGLNEKGEDF